MDALEYLRARERMCETQLERKGDCIGCPFWSREVNCETVEKDAPQTAIRVVSEWVDLHPVEGGIRLTAMEQAIVKLYIEKGYIWAARDMSGALYLYKREPRRVDDIFKNVPPATAYAKRLVITAMATKLRGITWQNSPVCLPKLLEGKETKMEGDNDRDTIRKTASGVVRPSPNGK